MVGRRERRRHVRTYPLNGAGKKEGKSKREKRCIPSLSCCPGIAKIIEWLFHWSRSWERVGGWVGGRRGEDRWMGGWVGYLDAQLLEEAVEVGISAKEDVEASLDPVAVLVNGWVVVGG